MNAPQIRQIATELISQYEVVKHGATVVLGAGASVASGIPAWPKMATQICSDFNLDTSSHSPEEAVHGYFDQIPYFQRYTVLHKYLSGYKPSLGHYHLAELVREGLISRIFTTNWDSLVETALYRVIPFDDLKILIRGELTDSQIVKMLKDRDKQPTLVKLHGDLQSRIFMVTAKEDLQIEDGLLSQLEYDVAKLTLVVGQSAQDVSTFSLLLKPTRQGRLYFVKYDSEAPASSTEELLTRAGATIITGEHAGILTYDAPKSKQVNIGEFDTFFTQLHLAVQREKVPTRRQLLEKAEESILSKERTGIGYINYSSIVELVDSFVLKVRSTNPDTILFIDDPKAPGGRELQRHMTSKLANVMPTVKIGTLVIQGDNESRAHNRQVRPRNHTLPLDNAKHILILDAVTFSGNTLALAREEIRSEYPNAKVQLGVLVASQQLLDNEHAAKERVGSDFLNEIVTDRHEIFFPWGVTQTTSNFVRQFVGATPDGTRIVRIAKRPWGTIEVLADRELASVRLLTIEAGCKLSFQRHLCRDELFVALDDNIGLDICAQDVPRNADDYYPDVKSLILEEGDYVLVPRGVWHRTKASMDRVRLLEVGFGLYDQDNDMERRWDDYDRGSFDGSI